MTSEPGTIEVGGNPEARPEHGDLSPRLTDIDRVLAEALAVLQVQSGRLASMEQLLSGEAPGDARAPKTETGLEGTVRRLTGSIDVRLDILEEELGGLQDELSQLQEVARESVDAAAHRLVRRFAVGQAVLAVPIVVLILMAWPGGGEEPAPGSRRDDPAALSMAPSAPHPGTDSATTPMRFGDAAQDTDAADGGSQYAGSSRAESSSDATNAGVPGSAVPISFEVDPIEKLGAGDEPGEALVDQGDSASGVGLDPDLPGVESRLEAPDSDGPQASVPEVGSAGLAPGGAGDDTIGHGAQQSAGPSDKRPQMEAETKGDGEGRGGEGPATPTGDPAPIPGPKGEAVVLDEERFAIQLIGFRSESSVAPFVKEFGIADTARFLHTRSQDRDWYLVLLGVYVSRDEAMAALKALPPRLRELEPWVRPLSAGSRLKPGNASPDAEQTE